MKKLIILNISAFVTIILLSHSALASDNCRSVVLPESHIIDKYMAEKYPELKFVIEDTSKFQLEIESRFEAQKLIDPKNPHGFSFKEVAIPTVEYAVSGIATKLKSLDSFKTKLQGLINSKNPWNKLFRKKIQRKLLELEIAEKYLIDLKAEGQKYLSENQITYRQSVEFLYFFSRAIGHFDARQFPFFSRMFLAVDRHLQGYEQYSMQTEYDLYKNRQFSVFQKESPVAGFKEAAKSFELAFADKNRLGTIFVPSHVSIDRDILIRLMNKNVNIIGVTVDPIAADGFLRPSGDFWIHDVRHESAKYQKREDYILHKQPTDEQILSLDKLQEKWMIELHQNMSKIENPHLKEAVSLMIFNYHHDRGYPMIPSTWINGKHNFVMHGLMTMLVVSGQGVGYWFPVTNTLKARTWINNFWLERLSEENAVFGL